MKQLYTLAIVIALIANTLSAQVLVSTDPMPKNAVLEEFTGIHCTYCPDGHAIAQSILDNNPGRVVVIAIHQGSFASPSAGEPDYRTPFGDPIAGQTGLTGYPSGTVNRHVFSGNNTALNRGAWAGACDQIMQETSPVNVGIASQYNDATRELTIDVELYYTANSATANNFINVVLIQDSIYGPQTGGGAGSNYRHMHMLRHMVTGQWGDQVTTTTQGSLVNRTYTYTVPANYNGVEAVVENMKVAVFVAQGQQEIITGDVVDAIGGTNLFIGEMTSEEPYIKRGYQGVETEFTISANSNIEGSSTFEFTLEAENSPEGWTPKFYIDGTEYTQTATSLLNQNEAKPIVIKVTPNESAGFPVYTLSMKSADNPSAPAKYYKVMLVSGVTDLVVNGTGGPEAELHQQKYVDGLAASGITSYAVTDANAMRDMIEAGAHQDIFTCWMNIAWTFPALSDSQAEALMSFMDEGHSVFIAGQDIGWDIMSGQDGSNGTPVTQNFYTNYLKAIYMADGSSANNRLNANTNDPIFGSVAQGVITDVYAGNMYPEEINAGSGAEVIFNYNTTSKNAAIKYDGEIYRSIYFGIGLEMLSTVAVRNEIIALSRQWLSDGMVDVEYRYAMDALTSGQNYPNPACDVTFINVTEEGLGGIVEISNINGEKVLESEIGNRLVHRINLEQLPSGIYTYRVIAGNKISASRKLIIVK